MGSSSHITCRSVCAWSPKLLKEAKIYNLFSHTGLIQMTKTLTCSVGLCLGIKWPKSRKQNNKLISTAKRYDLKLNIGREGRRPSLAAGNATYTPGRPKLNSFLSSFLRLLHVLTEVLAQTISAFDSTCIRKLKLRAFQQTLISSIRIRVANQRPEDVTDIPRMQVEENSWHGISHLQSSCQRTCC